MRGQSPLVRLAAGLRPQARLAPCRQCRAIQISAAPSTENPGADAFGPPGGSPSDPADARFEVLGSPYSLLSVTLSPSQQLYTRRGTLVAVAGNPETAQSTLSILSPLTRAFLGVPFLYQRISSTTPITALVATKSPTTTFSVLHLDGTTDWIVSQRNALLAWTGHTLSPTPRVQRSLGAAHWGATHLTGRGLAALSAPGQVYKLALGEGEEFTAHPSHVVAYSVTRSPPLPFRFRSSAFRLQVPRLTSWIPDAEFFRVMRTTETYKTAARLLYGFRTALRRTVWGDRLFLQFKGPATLLVSSRGLRVAEALTKDEVNEVADAPPGVAGKAAKKVLSREEVREEVDARDSPVVRTATVKDGRVSFEDDKGLKDRLR